MHGKMLALAIVNNLRWHTFNVNERRMVLNSHVDFHIIRMVENRRECFHACC